MNLHQVAKLIPAEFRNQILETNSIYKAVAVPSDPHMMILFTVWINFVNPNGGLDATCTKCLSEILGNYKKLQDVFLDIRKADQLLNEL